MVSVVAHFSETVVASQISGDPATLPERRGSRFDSWVRRGMLEDIGLMIDQYRAHDGTISGLSIVVSTDSAVALLREVFYRKHAKVEFTNDPDELFLFDGIPVRLRVRSTPGVAILAKNTDIPPRSCCDATATTTIAISMSWRKS